MASFSPSSQRSSLEENPASMGSSTTLKGTLGDPQNSKCKKSDEPRYLSLALPSVFRQAGLFLININPASLLIKHSSTNEKNKALKLALPYLSLAMETRESNFLSPPPAYTYSLNCKYNILSFKWLAVFLQGVQKVRRSEECSQM